MMKKYQMVTKCGECQGLSAHSLTLHIDSIPYTVGKVQGIGKGCVHCPSNKPPLIMQMSFCGDVESEL